MPPLPPSARRLRAALTDPGESRPAFQLWTQAPEEAQPWIRRGEYAELDWALDEARFPLQAPGTGVKVLLEGRLAWLGVVSLSGEVVPAPPLEDWAPGRPPDWLEAWEGRSAEGQWMLGVCTRVDRGRVVRAAAACARAALDRTGTGRAVAETAIEEAEAVALGRGTPEAAERASVEARLVAEQLPPASAWDATLAASRAAGAAASKHPAHLASSAAFQATRALGSSGLSRIAAIVREHLPLGVVLLSLLPRPGEDAPPRGP